MCVENNIENSSIERVQFHPEAIKMKPHGYYMYYKVVDETNLQISFALVHIDFVYKLFLNRLLSPINKELEEVL